MNLKDYQQQAKRTCPSLGSDKLDLAHMVLGVCSEVEEYVNATDKVNKSEECSDMNWYLANYCTFRGYNLEDMYKDIPGNTCLDTFDVHLSRLQDYVKKYMAYNKDICPTKEQFALKGLCYWVTIMYEGIDMEQSLQNNIDKLRVRFPDKFDEDLAKNRDLAAERKELEK